MSVTVSDFFDTAALARSPLHVAVNAIIAQQQWQDWPSDAQLTALLPGGAQSGCGAPLHFSSRTDAGFDGAAAYERHINETGEIPLRPKHWHDLFNALMWIQFPAVKTALNHAHRQELHEDTKQRSARRDALTLLDECGVLLAVTNPSLRRRHAEHQWYELFVEQRAAWHRNIVPMIIGHGLSEQCLQPYVGLTAKALYVTVPEACLRASPDDQRRQIDAQLAEQIAQGSALVTTKALLPLPLLGVPDWWPANEDPAFYANQDYFRPKRRAAGSAPRT